MLKFNRAGLATMVAMGLAMVAGSAPAQAAVISGQISGFGSAGAVIGQNDTDFQNPVGPPDGTFQAGQNPSNATGSYTGVHNLSGIIMDFASSGNAINLAGFMVLSNFTFTLDSVNPGSNYGGQNVWLFQDIIGGVIGTMVANGRVYDTNNAGNQGTFQATFTTQFQNTTSAQLISTLSSGTPLELQSYSFSVTSPNAVPEPGSWAMMLGGIGLVAAGIRSRRRQE